MNLIDLIKNQISSLLIELGKSIKTHRIFSVLFPVVGIIMIFITFWYYEILKEKVATELLSIAAAFIGSIFVLQIQEITKDRKKIGFLTVLDKDIDQIKLSPSEDGVVENKIFELFNNVLQQTLN